MKILEVKDLALKGVKAISYQRFADDRGYFTETYRESDVKKVLPEFSIKQVNESFSKRGVVRGLHFQWNPFQGKLIRTVTGHMVDLCLDIRKGSPTYGKIAAYDMPAREGNGTSNWIWLPVGFAHGVVFLEDTTIEYLCTSEYSPGNEGGINPLDPKLDWSLCEPGLKNQVDSIIKNGMNMSDKDKNGVTLEDWSKDPKSDNFTFSEGR